jgi:hypothetical protein
MVGSSGHSANIYSLIGIKIMRKSKWWFRTRKGKKVQYTSISEHMKRGYSTNCKCDTCGVDFIRNQKSNIGFEDCASCRLIARNKTPEARARSSKTFSSYYSINKNRVNASTISKTRFKDKNFVIRHKERCKERSQSSMYRQKLKDSAARGLYHAIKTSCGKQNISINEFEGFITGCDIRERELCKTTVGKECFKRENFTCEICCKKGNLHAHHKDGWHWAPERRFDLSNLVCLCHICHSKFHKKYGNKWNTEKQYEEYKQQNRHLIENH